MKRGASLKSRRALVSLLLFIGTFLHFSPPSAQAVNDVQAQCSIGSNSACPAQSPQEIYNLYGTTTNGPYFLNVNGVATQTLVMLNRSYPDSGGWFLGMKSFKGSSNFFYNSTYWLSQSSTLNVTALSDDVNSDAKFDAFNYLPVTKLLAVFKSRDTYPFNSSGSGDLGSNQFGGHTWQETVSATTMFSRFSTNSNLVDGSGYQGRYTLTRESNSASGKLVFPYQTGWSRYGFNNSVGNNYRWGITYNNETSMGSNDSVSGIGLDSYSSAAIVSYSDGLTVGLSGSNSAGVTNPGNQTFTSGFQIWGKMAEPSLPTPGAVSLTNLGAGSVRLSFAASANATEYAIQYRRVGTDWASGWTSRLTNPSANPSAVLTGLNFDRYDFRVFARANNNSSNTGATLLNQGVDSIAPSISSINFSSSPGADSIYGAGETLTATLGFSETVTVTGLPRIPVQGLTSKFLTYTSGSGTPSLTFSYLVTSGDVDRNGISILADSLALNGGSITDSALNSATLTHAAISNSLLLQVDGSLPIAGTPQTSSNGSSITITYDETLSATAPTAGAFSVSVNGVSNSVSSVSISGQSVQLTLSFSVISTASVTLAYVDPTAGNDVNALQDEAGNDAASISTTSVTNLSTSSSNTSVSISLNPAAMTAIFRTVATIRVSTNTAGRVDFYQSGKIIPNCRNVATSANVASCSWRPMVQSYVSLTARFRPSGSGFTSTNTAPLTIYVTKRTGLR